MNYPRYENVVLAGLARDEAPIIMESAEIEARLGPTLERLKLPRGLLASLTGILRRRLYPLDFQPSQAAARAAERLFAETGLDRQKVDLLYSTSVCRDHIEPSTASIVQHRLDLGGRVKSLDIGSACLGFIDGLELAALSVENGLAEQALVVAGENNHPILAATIKRLLDPGGDRALFFRNFATLTLGSGGAAAVLGRRENFPGAPRLVASVSRSDARSNHLCRGDALNMETDSAALMSAGVALARETFELGRAEFGWTPQSFDRLISHQVSAANTRKMCESLGLDEGLLVRTFPDYGNIGPVAVPFTLHLAREKGLLPDRGRLLLMGIGSGLCCSLMELAWSS
ncbi:MAG: 3-oxoacyl-ACP synthase III [Candidatus Adiutrix sp.]|jgi:3-oxoacyl-[acyl-carrier-protein] synthase-3|nr:3-oxoacyl-ACP synthase III [Candidatus Adiutrix sp.]